MKMIMTMTAMIAMMMIMVTYNLARRGTVLPFSGTEIVVVLCVAPPKYIMKIHHQNTS